MLRSILALATVSLVAQGCSASSDPQLDATQASIEVYGGDAEIRREDMSQNEYDLVLTKLFPGFLSNYSDCKPGVPGTVASLNGKTAGSFTGPGRTEMLYDLEFYDCAKRDEDGALATRLVVTKPFVMGAELEILATADMPGTHAFVNRTLDLDRDGQNEIVTVTDIRGHGAVLEVPGVYRFAGNSVVKDPAWAAFEAQLSAAFSDTCKSEQPNAMVERATIIATVSNGTVTYSEKERGTMPCHIAPIEE